MDIPVLLNKAPGQSLGIGFKKMPQPPYCQVYKLVGEGAARESGKVLEGDMLLSINGRNVQHQTPDEVRKLLSGFTQDTTIFLELRRLISNSDLSNGHPSSPRSPDIPEIVNISPEVSPNLEGRRRRQPVLPGIEEAPTKSDLNTVSAHHSLGHNHTPPLQDHRGRYSLTPQSLTPNATRRFHHLSLKPAKSLDLANLPQWRQHATPQVPLKNIITEAEMYDRLHTQGIKVREGKRYELVCMFHSNI